MDIAKHNSLVTVIVITYNSSKFVIDTLESVKRQSYKNIELIISDDCSKDDTFEKCSKWLETNKSAFKDSLLVKTPKNGGICVNYNNGLKYAHGKWVKYIAGDDILLPNCISSFIEKTKDSKDKIFICGVSAFNENVGIIENRIRPFPQFDELSPVDQEKFLIKNGTVIEGPTLFLNTDTLISNGGFDECYPMIEDYPLVMKYLSRGYHIGMIRDYLIKYREYPESVSRSGNNRFSKSIFAAIDNYAPKAAWRNKMYTLWWHLSIDRFFRKHYNNEWYKKPLAFLLRLTDIISIRKRIYRSNKL